MLIERLQRDPSFSLFLDRDGVINRRLPGDYVKSWAEFHFIEEAKTAIARLNNYFLRTIIVTNQQGIGKGLMTKADLKQIHRQMLEDIQKADGTIDGIYYCPELAGASCRKPNTGMAEQAKADFPEIDFQRSVMAGDSLSDMEFGGHLNMINVLIETKAETLRELEHGHFPYPIHYRFSSLAGFADYLEAGMASESQ